MFVQTSNLRGWLSRHALGSSCYGHTNLVPSFCRAYLRETSGNIIAIHAAKGSTDIQYWLPPADGYRMLMEKAKAAIKKATKEFGIGHIYFVWLQGESDAVAGTCKEFYKEKLHNLADALKAELGVRYFGIIRVGAFTYDGRDAEIIAAQDEVCNEDPYF